MESRLFLIISPEDDVAVALQDLSAGQTLFINQKPIKLPQPVPAKHKFALRPLERGAYVKMYGVRIGQATRPLALGEVLHLQNLRHAAEPYQLSKQTRYAWSPPSEADEFSQSYFWGYPRGRGHYGTANYWLVIPLVFCENRNVETLREILAERLGYGPGRSYDIQLEKLWQLHQQNASDADLLASEIILSGPEVQKPRLFPQVDGIKFLSHTGGCGGTRADSEVLCRLLAAYMAHPNVSGATILSLGCQNAQIDLLKKVLQEAFPFFDKPLYFLEQQKSRSEPDFIAEAVKYTFIGLRQANLCQREKAPLSALHLGLKCGGSDGFSGISANPVLGFASDLLVALGGTAFLAEFPELHGVEQALIDRCQDPRDAEKFIQLIQAYSRKVEAAGSSFAFNPSPGNIRDGLITDAMKSAGAARKGGTAPIAGVLDYTEWPQKPGLHLLCTPGNDVEATTGLAGSGANVMVFTTGLGTPTGNPICPTLKLSSNTTLFEKMPDLIDFDTGPLLRGESTIAELGVKLLRNILEVASGIYTPKAVRLGQDDFIPWKRDISL
ncbi:MAG: altronate dehydratase [Microscillaceae bacterium]|nr:altronate dehydratase [Microscillaceae bacterium]